MLINSNITPIKVFHRSYYYNDTSKLNTKEKLYYYLKFYDCSDGNFYNSFYGLYCGNSQQLTKEITSKFYEGKLCDIKNIIIDKSVTLQREKVRQCDKVKIVRDPNKADCCFCNKYTFNTKERWNKNHKGEIVIYSKDNDNYYIINEELNHLDQQERSFVTDYLELNTDSTKETPERWLDMLKDLEIIDQSCEIIYIGDVVLLETSSKTNEVYNILTKYNKILYVDSLNEIINDSFLPLTKEAFDNLENMFHSKDFETVELATRMLSSYNLNYICSMALLVIRNWYRIQDTKARHSIGFRTIMETLGCNIREFGWRSAYIIDELYQKSKCDEDKALVRDIIKHNIEEKIKNIIQQQINQYEEMDFKIEFTLE